VLRRLHLRGFDLKVRVYRRSVNLRPVLTAPALRTGLRCRRRQHKARTALRLATVGAPSTRRRINQSQRVRCVLFAYQVPPGAGPPSPQSATNFCANSAAGGDGLRPRLMDGREAFEEWPSPTVVQRPGARGGGRAEKRRAVPYRSLAVTRCYINVLLKTDVKVCFVANEKAEQCRAANGPVGRSSSVRLT